VRGHARVVDANTVEVDGRRINGRHIVLATGGRPRRSTIPGAELGIDSDGFFELPERPARVTLVGSGYVAVELAGVLAALGSEVSLVWRGDTLLRGFDPMLGEATHEGLVAAGVNLLPHTMPTALQRAAGRIDVHLGQDRHLAGQDTVIWAIGREPVTSYIDPGLGIARDAGGYIQVDEYQQTSVAGVYAIGDVTGKVTLTPVAIAAGRRLADRLWGGQADRKLSYENIPTVLSGIRRWVPWGCQNPKPGRSLATR
jgi:glutathione reductase (NADPH)